MVSFETSCPSAAERYECCNVLLRLSLCFRISSASIVPKKEIKTFHLSCHTYYTAFHFSVISSIFALFKSSLQKGIIGNDFAKTLTTHCPSSLT